MLKLVVNNEEKKIEEVSLGYPHTHPILKLKGQGPTSWDWLSPMESGTEFLCSHKSQQSWLLTNFTHGGKKEGAVLLIPTATMNNHTSWIWVDPIEFCKVFELRGILEIPDG